MRSPISKLIKDLNAPGPLDYGVNVKKKNPDDLSEAMVVVRAGGVTKQFTSEAREQRLPPAYARTMPTSAMPGRGLFQDGVG